MRLLSLDASASMFCASPEVRSLDEIEEKAIREALAKTNGNQSAAARMLGIGRHALIKRIEAYGIGRPRKTS
jgi:DNA-binding NtrC family response regulator